MRIKNLLSLSATGLFFLLIAGCASTNVMDTYEMANTGMPTPNPVLIYNFAVNPQDVFLRRSRGILRTIVRQRKKSSWVVRYQTPWQRS
jgi:hypothetical protein